MFFLRARHFLPLHPPASAGFFLQAYRNRRIRPSLLGELTYCCARRSSVSGQPLPRIHHCQVSDAYLPRPHPAGFFSSDGMQSTGRLHGTILIFRQDYERLSRARLRFLTFHPDRVYPAWPPVDRRWYSLARHANRPQTLDHDQQRKQRAVQRYPLRTEPSRRGRFIPLILSVKAACNWPLNSRDDPIGK